MSDVQDLPASALPTDQEIVQPVNKSVSVKKNKKKREGSAPVGRPTVMTDEVLRKLLEARADGATDVQACLLAEIGVATYYKYCKENPEFVEQMNRSVEILKVLANRALRKALEEMKMEEKVKLAWDILKENVAEEERKHRRSQDIPGRLPDGNIAPGYRLTSNVPLLPQQVNINLGGQQLNQPKVVRMEDLTDAELDRMARGEPIEQVLGDRVLAHK